jgi:hypothetical protein
MRQSVPRKNPSGMSENINNAKRGFLKTAMLGAGALGAATPGVALAQMPISLASTTDLALSGDAKLRHRRTTSSPTMTQRVIPENCAGAIIDVQDYFLSQLGSRTARTRMEAGTLNLARLLGYFHIPIIATLERPVDRTGSLPAAIEKQLGKATLFEKNFFDLARERVRGAKLWASV